MLRDRSLDPVGCWAWLSSWVKSVTPHCRAMNEIAAPPLAEVPRNDTPSLGRQMLNKVPEITLYFWIIKIL
jgi:hypothetical protein